MTEPLNPDWDGIMKARAKEPKSPPYEFVPLPPDSADATRRALDYAKKIIQSYEADVRAGAWTGVNLEAVGFCQGDIYKDALATIDRLARGEVVL